MQAVIRHQLGPDRQQATAQRVVALLTAASPGAPDDPACWTGYAAFAPHVLATAPLSDHHPAGRRLALDTARYLQAQGDSWGSRAVCEPLLARWRTALGPDHPDTLTAASSLARALVQVGEVESGRALAQDTLQRSRQALSPDHPTTLLAATGLTLALLERGEAEPAHALGQDTQQRCRQALDPDHPIARYLTMAARTGDLMLGGDAAADRPGRPL